ncbi:hypothetical protein, partial [Brucella intermedia]|uniref:hypothetical protein n=1 Tax=Brucella intermedia TaxID=94625 RepID=UPI00235DE28F
MPTIQMMATDIGAGHMIFNHTDDNYTFNTKVTSTTNGGPGTNAADNDITFNAGRTNMRGDLTQFVGPIKIDGATAIANITDDAQLGNGSATNTVSIDNGGTLEYGATTTSTRNLTLGTGGGNVGASAGAVATVNGVISGTGALGVTGPGTVNLRGANTYEGGTEI